MLIVHGEPSHSRTFNCVLMPDLEGCLCKNHLRQIVKNPMLKVTRNGPVKSLFYLELYSISSYLIKVSWGALSAYLVISKGITGHYKLKSF